MTTTVPHQALYRRWRAQRFAEIVGQTAKAKRGEAAVSAGGCAAAGERPIHAAQISAAIAGTSRRRATGEEAEGRPMTAGTIRRALSAPDGVSSSAPVGV